MTKCLVSAGRFSSCRRPSEETGAVTMASGAEPHPRARSGPTFIPTIPISLSAPRFFVFLLVIMKCLNQSAQDFSRSFEHCLKLRLVNFLDIFAEVISDFLKSLLHFLRVMTRVALGSIGDHRKLPTQRIR